MSAHGVTPDTHFRLAESNEAGTSGPQWAVSSSCRYISSIDVIVRPSVCFVIGFDN